MGVWVSGRGGGSGQLPTALRTVGRHEDARWESQREYFRGFKVGVLRGSFKGPKVYKGYYKGSIGFSGLSGLGESRGYDNYVEGHLDFYKNVCIRIGKYIC